MSAATTKREIVKRVAERTALTQAQARAAVQAALDEIVAAVIEARRLELRNFGVFEVKWRRARKARDPRDGSVMDLPPRHVVAFRPGKVLAKRLAELEPGAR